MFDEILGHEPIKAYLQRAIYQQRVPHALLFSGPRGVGKRTLALSLAQELLGTPRSQDLHLLSPDTKNGLYSIDLFKEMIETAQQAPFESKAKFFLLESAEKIVPPAAHLLLKTLEEPPPESYFVLVTSRKEEILPTLRSRCVENSFTPLSEHLIETLLQHQYPTQAHATLQQAARLSQGSMEWAQALLDPASQQKQSDRFAAFARLQSIDCEPEDFEALLRDLLGWFRDQLLQELGGDPSLLLYPGASRSARSMPPDLEEQIGEAHLAFSRQIKPAVCLDFLLRRLR